MAYINSLGQTRLGVRLGVAPTITSKLLDTYSGAYAAYSLRKLSTTYSGSAIRVRRSSDNGEQNIGFNADGNLDTTALLSFVGSGTGFVATWYDQSGNNRNATQVSASNQPLIVNGGVLYTLNGKAIIRNPNTNVIRCLITPISSSQTRPISIIASGKIYSLPSNGFGNVAFYLGGTVNAGGGSRYEFYVYNNSFGTQIRYQSTAVSSINTYNIYSSFIHQGHFASSVLTSRLNGIDSTTTITDSTPFAANSNFALIGANAITTDFMANIGMYEYIFYFSDRTSDRVGIESNINTYYSIYPPTVSDTDAQAFLNAAIITNTTQANAINTLVTDLKTAGVWTKMKAIYPFVGGTAESHKWNLKDPRDLNDAFRIQFYGGWTHSSTGILPNGSNAYADTKLIPSQQYSTNSSVSFGLYSRNDKLEDSTELSAYSGSTQNMGMEPRWSDGKFYGYAWQDGIGISSVTTNSGSLGLLSVTRQSYNILKTFRNNILIGNQAANVTGSFPTNSVRLSMGGVAGYSSREKAFAYIGDGISDNEISLLSTAVQRFQTSLSRHVGVPVGTILAKPVESPNIVSTGLVFNIDPSNTSSYPGTGTTVYDLSGNNYTGTLQSGCYYDSESLGNFVFDGINDYINLPHSILSGTGDFTVNVWVKNINSQYGTIFGNYPAGNLQIFYGSNSIGFWLNNDTAYMTSVNSNKETTTIPRMLTAIRRNGSILEVYLDGVLKKIGSSTSTIGSVSNFRMGTNTIGTEVMNTSIYTIQAYSRALSTGEITQNYNATKWRFGL